MLRAILRPIFLFLARLVMKALIKVEVAGKENLRHGGPLIIVSNHFSWFEVPLLVMHLPYKITFFAAAELAGQSKLLRMLFYPFDVIPVHRGQVDRTALRRAQQVLDEGRVLMIFPEGGIDPDLRETTALGQPVAMDEGQNSRLSAELISARPGAAFLATRSQAYVQPVSFLGTELVLGNMSQRRRTPVKMGIGPVFGPLTSDPALKGAARREQLDHLGDVMMTHIAALLPVENRGPYA